MPGTFPACGCHYTNDDDGIHFCQRHLQVDALLTALELLAEVVGRLPENARGTKQGAELHTAFSRARAVIYAAKEGG